MNYETQKSILEQYAEGALHSVEMIEALLATITPEDLKQYFIVLPAEFEKKLGLDPEPGVDFEIRKKAAEAYAARLHPTTEDVEARRKKEMQLFAVRLHLHTAGLLAETFDGFVPSIIVNADGRVVLVEQDVHHEGHRQDPNTLPTRTHVIEGTK